MDSGESRPCKFTDPLDVVAANRAEVRSAAVHQHDVGFPLARVGGRGREFEFDGHRWCASSGESNSVMTVIARPIASPHSRARSISPKASGPVRSPDAEALGLAEDREAGGKQTTFDCADCRAGEELRPVEPRVEGGAAARALQLQTAQPLADTGGDTDLLDAELGRASQPRLRPIRGCGGGSGSRRASVRRRPRTAGRRHRGTRRH